MRKDELDAAFADEVKAKTEEFEQSAKAAPKKKIEDEVDDFDAVSDSDDENKPVKKKAKKI